MAAAAVDSQEVELEERGSVASSLSSSRSSIFSILNSDLSNGRDTAEELEKLKQLVDRQSRQLSMTKSDREKFDRATSRYFAELNHTLKREIEADLSKENSDEESVQCEVRPVSEDHASKIISRVLAVSRRSSGRRKSTTSSASSVSGGSVTEEGRMSLYKKLQFRKSSDLYMSENSWVLDESSEEHLKLLEATEKYASALDEYLQDLSTNEHVALFRQLLTYSLEMGRLVALIDEDNAKVRLYCQLLSAIGIQQQIRVTPKTYFSLLSEICGDGGILKLTEELQDYLDSTANLVPITLSFLFTCTTQLNSKIFQNSDQHQESILDFRFSVSECQVCYCENIVSLRNCCRNEVCIECMKNWVTERVFSRSIPVSCPCCEVAMSKDEIVMILEDKSNRFFEVLADMNKDSKTKTCPNCNALTERPRGLKAKKRNGGLPVRCEQCQFHWCHSCHGPLHQGTSCKDNQSGKFQLREWSAATYVEGTDEVRKARKCPSCKMLIEKNQGCHHMTCFQCKFEFCYICGKNWRAGNFLFGKHGSKLSIFGCKKKFLPERPVLRKLIRGSLFVLESLGIGIGAPIALALILALSPIIGIVGIGVLIYKCKH